MFVALVIKHAKRLRHIVTSFVCPALPYFSTLSHKQNDLQGGEKSRWTQNVCFNFLYDFILKHF